MQRIPAEIFKNVFSEFLQELHINHIKYLVDLVIEL